MTSVRDDESMSMEAAAQSGPLSPFEQLAHARQILQAEARALGQVAKRLDGEFCRAVNYLHGCRGNVIVSGMGKAGLVGQKIMATLASTGTPSHFLHPAEAVHGDLGRVHRDDVMLILSQSGETEEIVRLLPSLAELGVPILAITSRAESTLGRAATVTIELGALAGWPQPRAPRRCWPWATPWRWSPAVCEVSAAKTSPASIRPGASGFD
jgi:arabinose-5-phosphate isomerase